MDGNEHQYQCEQDVTMADIYHSRHCGNNAIAINNHNMFVLWLLNWLLASGAAGQPRKRIPYLRTDLWYCRCKQWGFYHQLYADIVWFVLCPRWSQEPQSLIKENQGCSWKDRCQWVSTYNSCLQWQVYDHLAWRKGKQGWWNGGR